MLAQANSVMAPMAVIAAAWQFGLAPMNLGALLFGRKAGIGAALTTPADTQPMDIDIGERLVNPKLTVKKPLAEAKQVPKLTDSR
jgi:hypothetical protein